MEVNFTQVGQVGKSFGTDGYCKIKLFDDFGTIVLKELFLFLEEEDYHVPYRIESWAKGNSMIRFDDVKDQYQADALQAKKVYVASEKVAHLVTSTLVGLEGFTILDGVQKIGEILSIQELPHQLLATVDFNGKEIFIPIVEQLITEIDPEAKTIDMNLPDGILDL